MLHLHARDSLEATQCSIDNESGVEKQSGVKRECTIRTILTSTNRFKMRLQPHHLASVILLCSKPHSQQLCHEGHQKNLILKPKTYTPSYHANWSLHVTRKLGGLWHSWQKSVVAQMIIHIHLCDHLHVFFSMAL